jgi:hypothetical protein
MGSKALHTDAIIKLEEQELARLRGASEAERSELLALACRTAADLEASRIRMGFGASQPAPWPASTWEQMAKWAKAAREKK